MAKKKQSQENFGRPILDKAKIDMIAYPSTV